MRWSPCVHRSESRAQDYGRVGDSMWEVMLEQLRGIVPLQKLGEGKAGLRLPEVTSSARPVPLTLTLVNFNSDDGTRKQGWKVLLMIDLCSEWIE